MGPPCFAAGNQAPFGPLGAQAGALLETLLAAPLSLTAASPPQPLNTLLLPQMLPPRLRLLRRGLLGRGASSRLLERLGDQAAAFSVGRGMLAAAAAAASKVRPLAVQRIVCS